MSFSSPLFWLVLVIGAAIAVMIYRKVRKVLQKKRNQAAKHANASEWNANVALVQAELDEFISTATDDMLLEDHAAELRRKCNLFSVSSYALTDLINDAEWRKKIIELERVDINESNMYELATLLLYPEKHRIEPIRRIYENVQKRFRLYSLSYIDRLLQEAPTDTNAYHELKKFFTDKFKSKRNSGYMMTDFSLLVKAGMPVRMDDVQLRWFRAVGMQVEAPLIADFIFYEDKFVGPEFTEYIEALVSNRRDWELWEGKIALALCANSVERGRQAGYFWQNLQTIVSERAKQPQ